MRYFKFLGILIILAVFCTIKCQEEELNIEIEAKEKDKILSCAEISSQKFSRDAKIIEDISRAVPQIDREVLTQKFYADMMISCYHRITDKTVSSIFNNLVIVDVEWNDSYNNILKVDYSKYRNAQADFQLTPEQQLIFTKLQTVKEEYITKEKVRKEEDKTTFKIFGYSLKSIPQQFKLIYFIVIFALFAFGILHFLKKVMNKEGKEGKKKKKVRN